MKQITNKKYDKHQSTIGTIIFRYSEIPPDNWLICDGQKVKASEYPKLLDLYESSSVYNSLIIRDEKSGKIVSLEIPNFDGVFLIKVK